MSDDINSFEEEDVYSFKKYGAYGRFSASGSFPVDYVLTTFAPEELASYLTFARDINPGKQLDFDLLMQRDIDDGRVKREIEPYLNPDENGTKIHETVLFFPPLLAALVPVENKEMVKYYNPCSHDPIASDNALMLTYPNQFKIEFKLGGSGLNRYTMRAPAFGSNQSTFDIDKRQVRLHLKLALKSGQGVKLVVIDGQHRLKALIDIYDKNAKLLKDLIVPVCILFPPDSNEKVFKEVGAKVPHIPEVFRKLFVDVNQKAEQVGGHFTILLSDARLRSLVTRNFCSFVLSSPDGETKLASIEWNVKSIKDSTQIKRKYSISSVGVIDQALLEMFGEYGMRSAKQGLIDYWFGTGRFPELLKDEEGEDVALNWDELSLKQRTIIQKVACDDVVPDIFRLYFSIEQFALAYSIFNEEVERYRALSAEHGDGLDFAAALDSVIRYKSTSNGDAKKKIEQFERAVGDKRQAQCAEVIKFSIFHRAIFDLLGHLMAIGIKYSLSPSSVVDATIVLVNEALKNRGKLLSFSNSYMHHTVFSPKGTINPTKNTKVALSRLMFAVAGNRAVSEAICDNLKIAGDLKVKLQEEFELNAISSAHIFLSIYEDLRKKSFIKTYPGDFSMPSDKRAELASAQDEQKEHLREVKAKTRAKEDVSVRFDELIKKYVKEDVASAYEQLSSSLGYNQEILRYIDSDDDDLDEE